MHFNNCTCIIRCLQLCKSDGIPPQQFCSTYRTLQVVEKLMNEVIQKVLVTSVVVSAIFTHTVAMNVVIGILKTNGNYLVILLFLFLLNQCLLVEIVLLGSMSKIYLLSQDILDSLKYRLVQTTYEPKKSRELKRWFTSLTPVCVRFGTLNFVDRLTALNCIDFTNNLTVNLLLLNQTEY